MLDKSKLMINYENMNKLLHFLDVKNFSKIIYWSKVVSWEMTFCMHDVVAKKTKSLAEGVMFISFSCNEITIIDKLKVLGFDMCLCG
jgi:hypothetical protein